MAQGSPKASTELQDSVDAKPAKRFFVEMLTRDIELQDAVLDLLDNCLDGALRLIGKKKQSTDTPYKGYFANITFSKNHFSILDNCGGIDETLAKQYAFRLGRPDRERDKDLATVGVYGIGMKRAIFKIGKKTKITSCQPNQAFRVKVTPEWLLDDDDWRLPFSKIKTDSLENPGTSIEIEDLYPSISKSFDETFYDDFCKVLIEQYSFIIQKGFKVIVNGTIIEPKKIGLLIDKEAITKQASSGIAPYIYETNANGVEVSLTVGFYRDLPSHEEQEDEIEGRHSKDDAGWTIVCNDRVIVANDKTALTGWGNNGVPSYHSQFVAISGLVIIKSKDASLLPVTTTKRGIDVNSDIYWSLRERMVEGLKIFTNYTNKWKTPSPERAKLQQNSRAVLPQDVTTLIPSNQWKTVRTGMGGRQFIPSLPIPQISNPSKQIKFSRPLEEIQKVSFYFFEDKDAKPTDVGEACFDEVLRKAKKL
jgi:hypothetical protein